MKLWFDIESDGLLDVMTKIHCLVIIDENNKVFSCADQKGYMPITEGLALLSEADEIIAHNGQNFDCPAIKKIHPKWTYKKCIDTLIFARLVYPHIWDIDMVEKKTERMGSHALEAWGQRLGEPKTEFKTDWKTWSKIMQDYCVQDVVVLKRLYEKLISAEFHDSAIQLEHEFAACLQKQMQNGVPFDIKKATALKDVLLAEKEKVATQAKEIFPEMEKKEIFIPKRDNAAKGYRKGIPFAKITKTTINLGSRKQVGDYFKEKYGWQPRELTDKGNAKLNSEVFDKLPYAEAPIVSKYLEVNKRISQLSTGNGALIEQVKDGHIYGYINHNGARTGRCTHSRPNVSQVPSPKKLYGKEFRELFHAPTGKVFVGTDLKGIELRTLAHYLKHYDDGNYIKILLDGDIHIANQEAAGLATRDQAKTFIYALNYGAGNEKLGTILKPEAGKDEKIRLGKQARESFLTKMPGIRDLIADVKHTFKIRGFISGLDGRRLVPRAEYSSLNILLQSAGAVIVKKWTCLVNEMLTDVDFQEHIHSHDEILLS
ncbi:MAG: hypothetical protein DRI57_28545, partial [Deltaproteobacteria bacterium]